MKDKINKWYNQGLWNINQVRNAAVKGVITPEEYEEITGEIYA